MSIPSLDLRPSQASSHLKTELFTDDSTTAIQIGKRRLGALADAPDRNPQHKTQARCEERLCWVLRVAELAGEKGQSSAAIRMEDAGAHPGRHCQSKGD